MKKKSAKRAWYSKRTAFGAACLVVLGGIAVMTARSHRLYLTEVDRRSQNGTARIQNAYNHLPLIFEPAVGHASPDGRFRARGKGYSLELTGSGATFTLRKEHTPVRMQLVGATQNIRPEGIEELPSRTHYLLGKDTSRWRTNVANFAKVRYANVYPGIDLVYYGNRKQLEFDFVVMPGADPGAIRMRYDGARSLNLDPDTGDMVVNAGSGTLYLHKPITYQETTGRQPVDSHFVKRAENEIAFAVGNYDRSRTLVIDPTLVYSTYLGGKIPLGSDGDENDEGIGAVAVDSSGNAYVTGDTDSIDFPAVNAFQPAHAPIYDSDGFVTKISADGSHLIYSTYFGGSTEDTGLSIAVDSTGSAYVLGWTSSIDFPTQSPLQPNNGGGPRDTFLAKFSPSGSSLLYSTYLGGAGDDCGLSLGVDSSGNAYISGFTNSDNFPVQTPLQPHRAGGYDGFITKFNSIGSQLVYSTYLGGSLDDYLPNLALQPSGGVYVFGTTSSLDFPMVKPLQAAFGGGPADAILARLDASGSQLTFSTYLGGSGEDYGNGVAVDRLGRVYLAGTTNSTNFPIKNAIQPVFRGVYDGFVAKLNVTASALDYSTYLGGSGDDEVWAMSVDQPDRPWIIGTTTSADFPLTTDALQSIAGGGLDGFITELNLAGTALKFSTYFGGSNDDYMEGIFLDHNGGIYLTGTTLSSNFPTKNALQPALGGSSDAFVMKIAER